jgi:ABC-2 type transport system ATP-binding protein
VEDVNLSCNQLAIIAEGCILYKGTPNELIEYAKGHVWTIYSQTPPLGNDFIVTGRQDNSDGKMYRILGNPPPDLNPQNVEPSIEEGYLLLLNKHRRRKSNGVSK